LTEEPGSIEQKLAFVKFVSLYEQVSMTVLGSAKRDRKIKMQALVIFKGKKDTVLYHGELLDTQNTSVHGDGSGLYTFLRHNSSLPPRIVTVTRIFLLFLFYIDTSRL